MTRNMSLALRGKTTETAMIIVNCTSRDSLRKYGAHASQEAGVFARAHVSQKNACAGEAQTTVPSFEEFTPQAMPFRMIDSYPCNLSFTLI